MGIAFITSYIHRLIVPMPDDVVLIFVAGSMVNVCFKQKTAYELRISDWSSDVCSSDLVSGDHHAPDHHALFHVDDDTVGPVRVTLQDLLRDGKREEIGRASCRERVCQYV